MEEPRYIEPLAYDRPRSYAWIFWVFAAMVVGVILLVSCTDGGEYASGPTRTPDPLRYTQEAMALQATIDVRSTQEAIGMATSQAAEAATVVAFNLQSIHAEGTQQAAIETADALRAYRTATAMAAEVAATQYSAQLTQQAAQLTQAADATATERAWLATETAQAIAYQQTQSAMIATATQDAINVLAFQAAQNRQSTLDAASVAAASTAIAAQAAEAEAAAQRVAMTNEFAAWFRYAAVPLGLFIVAAIVYFGYMTWYRNHEVQRDPFGGFNGPIIDGDFVNPDMMVYPRLKDQNNVPPDMQIGHAGNMAKVAAVRALPRGDAAARRLVKNVAQNNPAPQQPNGFYIVGQSDPLSGRLLNASDEAKLEADWQDQNE